MTFLMSRKLCLFLFFGGPLTFCLYPVPTLLCSYLHYGPIVPYSIFSTQFTHISLITLEDEDPFFDIFVFSVPLPSECHSTDACQYLSDRMSD